MESELGKRTEAACLSHVVLKRFEGCALHYLERPYLGFILNMSSAAGTLPLQIRK
jgi:hypothetical protein